MVDRYLQAVSYWMPVAQRDDLVAELAEDIRSEIQDREGDHGRSLEEHELRELLQRRGHPLWVASRYLPPQWLLGPAVLPIYRQVLRWSLTGLTLAFVTLAVVFASLPEAPGREALARPGFWVWHGVLWAFAYAGMLTLVFAAIERWHAGVKATDPWDPARAFDLPASPEREQAAQAARVRAGAVGRLAVGAVFVAWWLGAWPADPGGELAVRLTPIWRALWWPILVLAAGSMALAAVSLFRTRPTRFVAALALARDVLGAGVVAALLGSGELVEIVIPGAPPDRLAVLVRTINLSLLASVAVFGLFYLAEAVRDLRRALGRAPLRHWALRRLAGD